MKKMQIVAGSCIVLLAIVSIGQLYLDRQPNPRRDRPSSKTDALIQVPAEINPVTVEELVETYRSSIEEGTQVSRQIALGSLLDELYGPEFAKSEIKPESGEAIAKAAIAVLQSSDADADPNQDLANRVAGFLASRTHGQTSRDYVMTTLEQGPAPVREMLLKHVGSLHGIGGRAVFEKLQEFGAKGFLSGQALPRALARTGGKKAIEPIVSIMKSTDNFKMIASCVIALEDIGEPEALAPAFERLEAVGMIDKPETLPWISGRLFAKYLETARESGLSRAIKAMRTRPSLVRHGLPALAQGLSKGDAETRRTAAEAIKKAVVGRQLLAKRGEELLAGQLNVETEPVLKAELTGGLAQVRAMLELPTAPETKQQ